MPQRVQQDASSASVRATPPASGTTFSSRDVVMKATSSPEGDTTAVPNEAVSSVPEIGTGSSELQRCRIN